MSFANHHIFRWCVHQSDLRGHTLQLRPKFGQLVSRHDRGSRLGVVVCAQRPARSQKGGLLDVPLDGVRAPSPDEEDGVSVDSMCREELRSRYPEGVAPESLQLLAGRPDSGRLRPGQVDDVPNRLDGVGFRPCLPVCVREEGCPICDQLDLGQTPAKGVNDAQGFDSVGAGTCMRSLDHLTLGVRLGHRQAPVDSRVCRCCVLEPHVCGPSVGELNLSHEEPRATQHQDVVVLELREVGVMPQVP